MSDTMDFNTDFNPASALLEVGVKQIETENELFVGQMALAMQNSADAYEDAHSAHNKKMKAAYKTAAAEGIQAGASLGAGMISVGGGVKMARDRSTALNQLNSNQPDPNTLPNGRPSAGSQSSSLQSGSHSRHNSIDFQNSQAPSAPPNASNAPIKDNGPNDATQPVAQANAQQPNQQPQGSMRQLQDRQQVLTEMQIKFNVMQMTFSGMSELFKGLFNLTGSQIRLLATADSVDAERKTTESEWSKERGSAARSLAEQFLSTAKGISQYISEAYQTTQSAIQKLSTVQA